MAVGFRQFRLPPGYELPAPQLQRLHRVEEWFVSFWAVLAADHELPAQHPSVPEPPNGKLYRNWDAGDLDRSCPPCHLSCHAGFPLKKEEERMHRSSRVASPLRGHTTISGRRSSPAIMLAAALLPAGLAGPTAGAARVRIAFSAFREARLQHQRRVAMQRRSEAAGVMRRAGNSASSGVPGCRAHEEDTTRPRGTGVHGMAPRQGRHASWGAVTDAPGELGARPPARPGSADSIAFLGAPGPRARAAAGVRG